MPAFPYVHLDAYFLSCELQIRNAGGPLQAHQGSIPAAVPADCLPLHACFPLLSSCTCMHVCCVLKLHGPWPTDRKPCKSNVHESILCVMNASHGVAGALENSQGGDSSSKRGLAQKKPRTHRRADCAASSKVQTSQGMYAWGGGP